MKLLDFKTPEFHRVQWASEPARKRWEPRINAINQALKVVELGRHDFLTIVQPEELTKLFYDTKYLIVLGMESAVDSYRAGAQPAKEGEKFVYRVAGMHDPAHIDLWRESFKNGDDETIGQLLGYPQCCIDQFKLTWGKGIVDPTWHYVTGLVIEFDCHVTDMVPYTNMFWRWMGIRPVFHLPCSYLCKASQGIGEEIIEKLPPSERAWILEILSMRLEYSVNHGILEVETPILRFIANSIPTAQKHTIKVDGKEASPIRFNRINGFDSVESMDLAHNTVLAALGQNFDPPPVNVMDLGCGDGTLLSKIKEMWPNTNMLGVESDTGIIDVAKRKGHTVYSQTIQGYFDASPGEVDLTLVSINRLKEMGFTNFLTQVNSTLLFVYSYEGELDAHKLVRETFLAGIPRSLLVRKDNWAILGAPKSVREKLNGTQRRTQAAEG